MLKSLQNIQYQITWVERRNPKLSYFRVTIFKILKVFLRNLQFQLMKMYLVI